MSEHPSGAPQVSYPASASTPHSNAASARNALALAALAVAAGVFLVGVVMSIAVYGLISAVGFEVYSLVMTVTSVLRVIAALVAVVLAVLALRHPGGRVLIGAALGIAAVEIVGTIASLLSALVVDLF